MPIITQITTVAGQEPEAVLNDACAVHVDAT
jgi:hypothetical protein